MGTEVQWTKDQKDVICLRDRDILVSAAAGSGKTAVLVERILGRITDRENPCDIDRLLVVTFTKAAAAEMRMRIGDALEKRLMEEPENEHIQKQMSLLHSAQISTIDSFCQKVVRNYFHVIDLDPVYRIAEPADLDLMKQEVLEDLLEDAYLEAKEKKDQTFFLFTEIFSAGRTDHDIEYLILNLYDKSTSMPFPEDWIVSCEKWYELSDEQEMEQAPWMQALLSYVKKNIKSYLAQAKHARNLCLKEGGPDVYLDAVGSDLSFLESLSEKETYDDYQKLLQGFVPAKLKAARSKTIDPKLKEQVKNLREGYLKKGLLFLRDRFFFQNRTEMYRDMKKLAPYMKKLVSLVRNFHAAFSQKKQEEGVVDFADVEHFALDILVDKGPDGTCHASETALELRESYEEIMIDEYQDSNEVQELILTSLSGGRGGSPTLFMVGDVKQSIYKFRMAKPEIFLEKYKRFTKEKGPEQKIDLHKNFRSRQEVLKGANDIFEQIMTEDLGGIAYDEAASLVPGAVFEETAHRTAGKVEVLLIDRDKSGKEIGHVELEAAVAGEKIRAMVQGADPLYVAGKNGYHPAEYRDIAILLRTMSGWSETFVRVLNDMGIPAYADTKTGYFTSLEVETLLSYLHLIDNPRQDIPLAAVLRSFLGKLTDEELARIGGVAGQHDFWGQVLACLEQAPDTTLGKKLDAFKKQLEYYQEFSRTRSVYELLQKIFEETGYYDYMAAMPSGEKRKANLDILLEQAVEFAKYGHRGIYRFTRYIENLKKAEVDFGEASVASENTNAVRIMSIHKSKGLEFPVVFVAGMGKQFNFMDMRKQTVIDGNFGVGCDFIDTEFRTRQPTILKNFMANQMRLELLEEEIRVLYVALTRAKEKLYISGTALSLGKVFSNDLMSAGEPVGYQKLSTATSYLQWITAALFHRGILANEVISFLDDLSGEEEVLPHAVFEDDLFRLEILSYQDILAGEKEQVKGEIEAYLSLEEFPTDLVYDQGIRDLLERQQNYRYPFAKEAELPVKISVSELKRREQEQLEKIADIDPAETMFTDDEKEPVPGTTVPDGEKEPVSGTVTADGEKDLIPRPKFLQEETAISGAARGTLYHLVMEHFPYQQILESKTSWGVKEFDAFLSGMTELGYMTQQEKEELDSRKFVTFLHSDLGQRMAEAFRKKKLCLEQPFMMGLPAKEIYREQDSAEMILVQGIIDAFFFQTLEDGTENLVLVDYKTDFVKKGDGQKLADRYRSQLDYYAQALRRMTGREVAKKIIYSFSLGEEIMV